jgi:hypothetical protein
METFLTVAAMTAPFVVLVNCIMIASLIGKANRFEKTIARYENREHLKLERDTLEALTLLRTGKTEEAKRLAQRIIDT